MSIMAFTNVFAVVVNNINVNINNNNNNNTKL